MVIADTIRCSNCAGPVEFRPGEILATCSYCGFMTVIGTGKAFSFEHSLLPNKFDTEQIDAVIQNWMRSGFLKPSDLARNSKIQEKNLIYLPFWVVSAEFTSKYRGIFERITPAITKEGEIRKEYNWLVLARKASNFPTREYDVPLGGKIPYDFRKIEAFAAVLNSEIDRDEASALAKQQVEAHHRYLLQKDVDRIIEMNVEFEVKQTVFLHAPIWFIKYIYKGAYYQLTIEGASGSVIKGDIPAAKF